MFACSWLAADRLVACSRDQTVRVWNTDGSGGGGGDVPAASVGGDGCGWLPRRQPETTRHEHGDRIRDMAHNMFSNQLVTLGVDGCVKLWDANSLRVQSSLDLKAALPQGSGGGGGATDELVCLAFEDYAGGGGSGGGGGTAGHSSLAIGSRRHLTFVDPRVPVRAASCADAPPVTAPRRRRRRRRRRGCPQPHPSRRSGYR